MLKALEVMEDLLKDNNHIVRFHSLRAQDTVIPWALQLSLRDAEFWTLMNDLANNSVWGLFGMSVKQHNQMMSRNAQTIASLLGQTSHPSHKGQGKGKNKAKGPKS